MGEAFITRRGGGIPYAIIGVTYPSGSTCTCTNGTRTLTGKDTSGKALFVIPAAGTWTVKAVKGSNSASKAVKITAEGQVETVKLAYALILFDGADNTAVTGGLKLQVGTYDSAVVSSAPISGGKITFNKTGYVGVYPAKKADITKGRYGAGDIPRICRQGSTCSTPGASSAPRNTTSCAACLRKSDDGRYRKRRDLRDGNRGGRQPRLRPDKPLGA